MKTKSILLSLSLVLISACSSTKSTTPVSAPAVTVSASSLTKNLSTWVTNASPYVKDVVDIVKPTAVALGEDYLTSLANTGKGSITSSQLTASELQLAATGIQAVVPQITSGTTTAQIETLLTNGMAAATGSPVFKGSSLQKLAQVIASSTPANATTAQAQTSISTAGVVVSNVATNASNIASSN
jgi:hypothetical protein